MKTLLFEGAGWSEADISKDTIGNCRVRTAFTNDEGKQIYLELDAAPIRGEKIVTRYWMYIDHVFYIASDHDDCNKSQMKFDYDNLKFFAYSREDITKWINTNLNCSFDTIKVLPKLAGYRVHKDNGGFNLMDNFNYNPELTKKREAIEKYFYNLEKSESKKYPNFSIGVDLEDENILHLLRSFSGYNKHWIINANSDNWLGTLNETKLGKYGC